MTAVQSVVRQPPAADGEPEPPPYEGQRPAAASARAPRIAYFAHYVNHPDIPRRLDTLTQGGANVRVLGYRRGGAEVAMPFVDLGRTEDARMAQRALSVLKALITLPRWAHTLKGVDVVVARNLETLAVAVPARRLAAPKARLVYECLDIHRLMSGSGIVSRLLRGIERRLLASADALMVSSPGFVREYFAKLAPSLPPTVLVENKVGVNEKVPERQAVTLPAGPPWRIGWFGVIRCKRSLDMLIEAARRNPGLFEVVIGGRAAVDVVGDLTRELPERLGIRYVGPFAGEEELAELYRSVHFAWLVDFYEAGANSDWLLPNRLYRSIYYGAAPIALSHVETGRWLEDRGVGLLLDEASPDSIAALLAGLSERDYLAAKARLEEIPTAALVNGPGDCADLVDELVGSRSR